MPYELYNILHIIGAIVTLMALGAAAAGAAESFKKVITIQHGVGLLLLLVGGFGMLARLEVGFPPWVWVKLALWLGLGALLMQIRLRPQHAKAMWFASILVAATAVFFAIYKPI